MSTMTLADFATLSDGEAVRVRSHDGERGRMTRWTKQDTGLVRSDGTCVPAEVIARWFEEGLVQGGGPMTFEVGSFPDDVEHLSQSPVGTIIESGRARYCRRPGDDNWARHAGTVDSDDTLQHGRCPDSGYWAANFFSGDTTNYRFHFVPTPEQVVDLTSGIRLSETEEGRWYRNVENDADLVYVAARNRDDSRWSDRVMFFTRDDSVREGMRWTGGNGWSNDGITYQTTRWVNIEAPDFEPMTQALRMGLFDGIGENGQRTPGSTTVASSGAAVGDWFSWGSQVQWFRISAIENGRWRYDRTASADTDGTARVADSEGHYSPDTFTYVFARCVGDGPRWLDSVLAPTAEQYAETQRALEVERERVRSLEREIESLRERLSIEYEVDVTVYGTLRLDYDEAERLIHDGRDCDVSEEPSIQFTYGFSKMVTAFSEEDARAQITTDDCREEMEENGVRFSEIDDWSVEDVRWS